MNSKITLLSIAFLLTGISLTAQIKVDNSAYKWSRIEDGDALSNKVNYTTNDGDNGDGAKDGAIRVKGIDTTASEQGVQYALAGKAVLGETINIETVCYQNASSNVKFKVQLWDATASALLSEIKAMTLTSSSTPPAGTGAVFPTLNLSYTFVDADVNHQVEVRFVRMDDLNIVRELGIDYLKVNNVSVKMKK